MPKFKVLTPVEHDGERAEPGAYVELDAKAAEPLLAVNAIERASKAESTEAKPPAK